MAYRKFNQSKYRARKTEVDGIKFDSKKEADRYKFLKSLVASGEIKDLVLQKSFLLIPAQYESYERYGKQGQRLKDGRRCIESQCTYKADFCYTLCTGESIVEDVKGFKTPEYKIKRKLMLERYGIKINEV